MSITASTSAGTFPLHEVLTAMLIEIYQLMDNMRLDARTEFHRVIIASTTQGLQAHSTGGQRSSRATSLSGANGLVVLPAEGECIAGRAQGWGTMQMRILIGELQPK